MRVIFELIVSLHNLPMRVIFELIVSLHNLPIVLPWNEFLNDSMERLGAPGASL